MKCYFDLPEYPNCYYKRNWINQIRNGVRSFSKFLTEVNIIENADIIICLVDDVLIHYSKFKDEFDEKKKFILVVSQRDILSIRDDIINNDYVIAFLSCFKFKHSNPKNISILNTSSTFKRVFNKNVKLLKDRKYDITFLGKINYGDSIEITEHRTAICNKLIEIGKKNNLNYLVKESINRKTYLQTLGETKIFVSPWGYGEWSLKDSECICMGANVLVPKNNIITYPNFYDNFDDFDNNLDLLEEKILNILNNLENTQIKVNKNRELFRAYNLKEQILVLDKYLVEYFNKLEIESNNH